MRRTGSLPCRSHARTLTPCPLSLAWFFCVHLFYVSSPPEGALWLGSDFPARCETRPASRLMAYYFMHVGALGSPPPSKPLGRSLAGSLVVMWRNPALSRRVERASVGDAEGNSHVPEMGVTEYEEKLRDGVVINRWSERARPTGSRSRVSRRDATENGGRNKGRNAIWLYADPRAQAGCLYLTVP